MSPMTLDYLRCEKCNRRATDKNTIPTSGVERKAKYNSWDGWLCVCGHYNASDP